MEIGEGQNSQMKKVRPIKWQIQWTKVGGLWPMNNIAISRSKPFTPPKAGTRAPTTPASIILHPLIQCPMPSASIPGFHGLVLSRPHPLAGDLTFNSMCNNEYKLHEVWTIWMVDSWLMTTTILSHLLPLNLWRAIRQIKSSPPPHPATASLIHVLSVPENVRFGVRLTLDLPIILLQLYCCQNGVTTVLAPVGCEIWRPLLQQTTDSRTKSEEGKVWGRETDIKGGETGRQESYKKVVLKPQVLHSMVACLVADQAWPVCAENNSKHKQQI